MLSNLLFQFSNRTLPTGERTLQRAEPDGPKLALDTAMLTLAVRIDIKTMCLDGFLHYLIQRLWIYQTIVGLDKSFALIAVSMDFPSKPNNLHIRQLAQDIHHRLCGVNSSSVTLSDRLPAKMGYDAWGKNIWKGYGKAQKGKRKS